MSLLSDPFRNPPKYNKAKMLLDVTVASYLQLSPNMYARAVVGQWRLLKEPKHILQSSSCILDRASHSFNNIFLYILP